MDASMVPAEGSPGSTGAAPSSPMAETIPTNPATIAQSTSINTLDQILVSNWIYDSTFTVSTTQSPGTIVYYKKVHPRGWNWANTHVAAMFNCYTGSGSVRYRPVATVWYGGSIRVGFLPPSIAEEDIGKIPIEVLTTYPNRDIDPKNTGWVEFSPPDERNIAYHYMDDTGRQSFGGWVVFYVAARLVTQSSEFTTINMLVETRGGFMFDQPNPNVLSRVVTQSHPLSLASKVPVARQNLNQVGLTCTGIQIEANTTLVVNWPGFRHAAFGVQLAIQPSTDTISGITKTNKMFDTTYMRNDMSFDPTHENNVSACWTASETSPLITEISYSEINYNDGGKFISFGYTGSEIDKRFAPYEIMHAPYKKVPDPLVLITNIDTRTIDGVTMPSIARQRATESIVTFTNSNFRSYQTQTDLISLDVARFKDYSANSKITFVYQLLSDSGTPLMYLRLWPNGLITTNSQNARTLILATPEMSIRYLQSLSSDDPLPPVPATYLAIRPMVRAFANGKMSLSDYSSELQNI